jgi:hypothetical protein
MARGFEERINSGKHAELVGLLAQDENAYPDNQRLKLLLRNARLRQPTWRTLTTAIPEA